MSITARVCIGLLLAAMSVMVVAKDFTESAGDVLQLAIPLTALAATYSMDDPDGRVALLKSYGTTFVLTHALKRAVDKERPDGSDRLSFPSGHTSSAFSGASFLAKRYGWDVGVPAYLAASFVGYSRVHADKHDGWDVVAGATLAITINEWLVSGVDDVSFGLAPTENGFQLALGLRY